MRALAIVSILLLAGCFGKPLTQPTTFLERAAYAEASAQGMERTVFSLTCLKYTPAGTCTEPGKPLHPARSKGYVEELAKARKAARTAIDLPATGGDCLGQQRSPEACLGVATAILNQLERVLADAQKGKP